MWLGSHVAVALAQASNYSSDSTPSLGTSICCRSGPRNGKKTKKKKKKEKERILKEVREKQMLIKKEPQ